MAVSSLSDVLKRLSAQVPGDLALGPICTRVMLRTGVNLRSPRPDQVGDGALVGKVVATLSEMGYAI